MSKVIFDFDGTVININDLHISAWNMLVASFGLSGDISIYFTKADVATANGRYDSYERIKNGLMKEDRVVDFLATQNIDNNIAPRWLMDMKEAYLLRLIEDSRTTDLLNRMSADCGKAIDTLFDKGQQLYIVSSSRELVILSVLKKIGMIDAFIGVYGEESMTDSKGLLRDKPDPYVAIRNSLKSESSIYVGDNGIVDAQFAANAEMQFIRYYWGSNMHTVLQGVIYG